MELGYLTKEGYLVSVDSFGQRTICESLRIDESTKTSEFVGVRRTFERVAAVQLTVWLHRKGWANPGERILRRGSGTLYRTRTGYYVIGRNWRRIKGMTVDAYYWRPRPSVFAPFLWKGKFPSKPSKFFPPGRKCSFAFRFLDQTVIGCRRTGRSVQLLGVEFKEFVEFVIGKISAQLEFENEGEAESFAKNFPTVDDPIKIDPVVQMDVQREKRLSPTRKEKNKLLSMSLAVVGIPLAVLAAIIVLRLPFEIADTLQVIPTVLAVLYVPTIFNYRKRLRIENRDLRQKWPQEYFKRWMSQFPQRTGAVIAMMKDLNVTLDPSLIDLKSLQDFLQQQPPGAFFGAMALDISGYLGVAFLQIVGARARFKWVIDSRTGEPGLFVENAYLTVHFIQKIRDIWISKGKEPIDYWLWNTARMAQDRIAMQPIIIYISLGFLKDLGQISQFHDNMRKAIPISLSKQLRMGENVYRTTWIRRPSFEIAWNEIEKQPPGWSLATVVAVPFYTEARTLDGKLEANSPRSPAREDVAIVRFKNNELVPLGVLLHNYLEVGPSYVKRSDQLQIKTVAAVEEAQVITQRVRDLQPQAKEGIGPRNIGQGIPTDSSALFMGRILSVAELENSFSGIALWRVDVEFSGFKLELLVRKDKCTGNPQPGFYMSGILWLLGDLLPPETIPSAEYIG